MTSDDTATIIAVINRYALAVDSRRWELFDEVFDVDAEVDFGRGARWQNRDSLKTAFKSIHAAYDATVHVTTNHVVTIEGVIAHCVSYVHGTFLKDTEGGNCYESAGWYDDRLRRSADSWRITHRTCKMVWCKGNPRVMGAPESPIDPSALTVLTGLHQAAADNKIAFLQQLTTARVLGAGQPGMT